MATPPENSFIPLAPGSPNAAKPQPDFRIAAPSQPANAQPFHALGQKPSGPAHAREPRVTLRRENNRVTAIVVECSCGQTMELNCVYEEPAVPPLVALPAQAPVPVAASPLPPQATSAPAAGKTKGRAAVRKPRR